MGPIGAAYPQTAKLHSTRLGLQRKCVCDRGWLVDGVDVDTVRGVTLGLTAGTWEWPLVTGTGHRVTDASSVWAATTEQQPVTLFIFIP